MKYSIRSYARGLLPALFGIGLLLLGSQPAQSTLVSPSALFLSPAAVGPGIFPTQDLDTGDSFDYTSGFVGGTILGVQILPLLLPNPGSANGAYTPHQLAQITVSNYQNFYAFLPGRDYSADLAPSDVDVSFGAAGNYFVQIMASNGAGSITRIFKASVDDFAGDNPPLGEIDDPAARMIKSPEADLILVSKDQLNGYSPNALATLQAEGKNVQVVATLADAVNAIMAESKKLGRKISVALVGHGTPGTIMLGNQFIANGDIKLPGNPVRMTPKAIQGMIDQFANAITFVSCCTGRGKAGSNFVDDFSSSLNSVGYFKNVVTAVAPGFNSVITGFQRVQVGRRIVKVPIFMLVPRAGYFDLNATASCNVAGRNNGACAFAPAPEPASIAVFAAGLVALVTVGRRSQRRAGVG